MQILVVEPQPEDVAHSLCDKHVVSQLDVVGELLGLAHTRNGELIPPLKMLKPRTTHMNHPFAKWVSATSGNYNWTHRLAVALCDEYEHRYKFAHWYKDDIMRMMYAPFKLLGDPQPLMAAPCVMPTRYYIRGLVVASYRKYYSQRIATVPLWTRRRPPMWFYFT